MGLFHWQTTILVCLFATLCSLSDDSVVAETRTEKEAKSLIDFSDRQNVESRRPIIVAHRGGVVSADSPECSTTAIRLAADQGYDMVELDIQMSRDGIPIVFHDRNLKKACGQDSSVAELSAQQLESISYVNSEDKIIRLSTALELCRRLRLGVMLDFKAGRDSESFLQSIDRLLTQHGLANATISISGSDQVRRHLKNVRFTPTAEEMQKLRAGDSMDLDHRFWFGLPQSLKPGDIKRLKSAGALVIPAINTFRYPIDKHMAKAANDIRRLLKEEVDGFQIDSVYYPLFRLDSK